MQWRSTKYRCKGQEMSLKNIYKQKKLEQETWLCWTDMKKQSETNCFNRKRQKLQGKDIHKK